MVSYNIEIHRYNSLISCLLERSMRKKGTAGGLDVVLATTSVLTTVHA
jgi:hypothetical protein